MCKQLIKIDARHINRCQLPWTAKKKKIEKQFSFRKIYNVPGRRHRPRKARVYGQQQWGSRRGTLPGPTSEWGPLHFLLIGRNCCA